MTDYQLRISENLNVFNLEFEGQLKSRQKYFVLGLIVGGFESEVEHMSERLAIGTFKNKASPTSFGIC